MDEQEVKNALPVSSKLPYLIAVAVMMAITLIIIAVIAVMRPEQDNMILYVFITGFSTTATGALAGFMKSQETHLAVNSRLEQLLKSVQSASRAEGELVGRAAGRQSADDRTDVLKVESQNSKPGSPC